jgi:ABC-type phosphate/phosphonate transport system substrate-binding protein
MIASLPMYDWPEVQSYNDQMWNRIRAYLLPICNDAPEHLTRGVDDSADFLITQTCGLPLVTQLSSDTVVLGTPCYAVDWCDSGYYASVIAVRSTDNRDKANEFRAASLAVNSMDSQSGYNSVKNLLSDQGLLGAGNAPFFKALCISGSHRNSVRMVASGKADICAIDPVSWRLAQEHEPAAKLLKVIDHTPYTPGLPLVSSANAVPTGVSTEHWQQTCREAFKHAINSSISRHLFISDIDYIDRKHYEAVPIRDFTL